MKHNRINRFFLIILCLFLAALLAIVYVPVFTKFPACLVVSQSEPDELVSLGDELVPLSGKTNTFVRNPVAPGTVTFSNASAVIDVSNVSEGYVMVKYTAGYAKIKVQIKKNGVKTYTYDIKSYGSYEVFPLTMGDGNYSINVFKNVDGTSYAQVLGGNFDVKLSNSFLPYLYPSQYVNFDATSTTVKKSEELAKYAAGDLEIVSNVYNYVINDISYDEQKAAIVKSGYLPVVDDILDKKKGICFDYAALMAAMLRSQQVPTRLEVGYVSGGAYHAWLSTYIKDIGWINNMIQFDGKSWKMMDPTFASGSGQSASVMKYIGNGSNYDTQYYY